MVENGCHPDIETYTTLIATYCQQRQMEESQKLFDKCLATELVPTTQTYTSMIAGYCKVGKSTSALRVFERMVQNGCLADSITYGALISGLCKESRLEEARSLYEGMLDKCLVPCEVTPVTLAFEYCRREKTSVAVSILDRLDKRRQTHTISVLVRKLSAAGNVDDASLFLKRALDQDWAVDHVTYTGFINSCYTNNRYALASEVSDKISKRITSFQENNAAV
jgi:pentatricopeptide repeat protein